MSVANSTPSGPNPWHFYVLFALVRLCRPLVIVMINRLIARNDDRAIRPGVFKFPGSYVTILTRNTSVNRIKF